MAKLYSTRYKGVEITCRAGTAEFDALGHAEVPDDKADGFVEGLRDTVLVVEKKPEEKKPSSTKTKSKSKTKTSKKKKDGK